MLRTIILFFFLASANALAQVNPNQIASTIEENQNRSRIDSIAKLLNLKGGDQVRIFTQFTVGDDGYLENIVAKGPHPVFEEEAVRVLKEVPKMDLPDGVAPRRFALPIIFVIETEKQKRKRLKKEKKAREKMEEGL